MWSGPGSENSTTGSAVAEMTGTSTERQAPLTPTTTPQHGRLFGAQSRQTFSNEMMICARQASGICTTLSGHCLVTSGLLLLVTIMVGLIIGKESTAERGLSVAWGPCDALHKVWPWISWKSGQTTQQASHPQAPSGFRKWDPERSWREEGTGVSVCLTTVMATALTGGVGKGRPPPPPPCWSYASSPRFHPEFSTSGRKKARIVPGTPNYGRKASRSQRT